MSEPYVAESHCHGSTDGLIPQHQPFRRMLATFALTAIIMVGEFVVGYWSQSLALWADAGHMLTDLLAISVSLIAISLSQRPADHRRTYGYRRLEVLAAMVNAVTLLVVALNIVYEAIGRLLHPSRVDIGLMLSMALMGLLANVMGLFLLGHHHHNINIRGAFLHLAGDTASSLAVVLGGMLMYFTQWPHIDPLLSIVIAVIIVVTSLNLLREVVEVLLEAAPAGLNTHAIRQSIVAINGVMDVHDLHVWSITAGMPALSAHIVVQLQPGQHCRLLEDIQHLLEHRYQITHSTLQFEHALDSCNCKPLPTSKL